MTSARTHSGPPNAQPKQHVIAEYKHRAQTVTCVCGWHGSTEALPGQRSPWTEHVASNRQAK
jgi:hypothetical protein